VEFADVGQRLRQDLGLVAVGYGGSSWGVHGREVNGCLHCAPCHAVRKALRDGFVRGMGVEVKRYSIWQSMGMFLNRLFLFFKYQR
jgi:hypothetical protein